MKNKIISVFILFSIIFSTNAFAETSTYEDIDFPQWTKDLRRTEIITFGSLPFVTLWVTLGYSEIVLGEFHNPLDKSAEGLSSYDQKQIIKIAGLCCLGLGLTDLAINLIQRNSKSRKKVVKNQSVLITPSKKILPEIKTGDYPESPEAEVQEEVKSADDLDENLQNSQSPEI